MFGNGLIEDGNGEAKPVLELSPEESKIAGERKVRYVGRVGDDKVPRVRDGSEPMEVGLILMLQAGNLGVVPLARRRKTGRPAGMIGLVLEVEGGRVWGVG